MNGRSRSYWFPDRKASSTYWKLGRKTKSICRLDALVRYMISRQEGNDEHKQLDWHEKNFNQWLTLYRSHNRKLHYFHQSHIPSQLRKFSIASQFSHPIHDSSLHSRAWPSGKILSYLFIELIIWRIRDLWAQCSSCHPRRETYNNDFSSYHQDFSDDIYPNKRPTYG